MKIDQKKLLINCIILITLTSIIVWILIKQKEENSVEQNIAIVKKQYEEVVTQNSTQNKIKDDNNDGNYQDEASKLEKETEKSYSKEDVQKEYKGYDVCAKLQIPEISLETYILTNYSSNALNISVTKFWGVNPNQIGNFCVAGHNFNSKNMFKKLKNLKIGNTLFITDNMVGKVEYQVFYMNTVFPNDTSCLDPKTKNQKEVTLITCTSNSEKRIIIKAKEVQKKE